MGCLGEGAWQAVKGVSERVGGVVGDSPAVTVATENDETVTERERIQDASHFQAPDDIRPIVASEPGWDLLAEEDDIWQEPSRQTLIHLRRLLKG